MRKCIRFSLISAAVALAPFRLFAQAPTPAPAPAASTSAATASSAPGMAPEPTPTPSLVDNIIRLWKANLSEDFLKKYVSTSDIVKDLTADDIVRLRNAGLPENLILAITQRKADMAAAAAGTPGAGAAAGAPGAAAAAGVAAGAAGASAAARPAPTPVPTPPLTIKWEGLARRNSGIVVMKSRWDPGILEVKDETLRWTDAHDVTKNLQVPLKSLTEQQLTCLKKAGGNECFEWVAKTKKDEFRFRNIAWEQNEDDKIEDIYKYMQARDPKLVSSQVPVDQK